MAMEECIRVLRKSLTDGRLLLNNDETEFLVIETKQQLPTINLAPSVCKLVIIILMLR